MGTNENLQEAFAGESQASRKYTAFAKKAERDGFAQVARLFRAAAEAESVHAQAHLRVLGGIQDTAANLEVAIAGEYEEFTNMYPEFIAEAEKEENRPAIKSMKNAMAVEKIHHKLYTEALDAVKAGNDLAAAEIRICPICGHTVVGDAPHKCEICGAPGAKFYAVQ